MECVRIEVYCKGAGAVKGQILGEWDQINHRFLTGNVVDFGLLPDDMQLMQVPGGPITLGMLRKSFRSQKIRIVPRPSSFGNSEYTGDTPEEVANQSLIELQRQLSVFGYTRSSAIWRGTTPSSFGYTFRTAGPIRITFDVTAPSSLGGPVDRYRCVVRLDPVEDRGWLPVGCLVRGGRKTRRFLYDEHGWGEPI